MSDDEFVETETHDVSSTADQTISQIQVSKLRLKHYIIVRNEPCVILELHVSKNGKHGSAKAVMLVENILNGRKSHAMFRTSSMVSTFVPQKTDYTLCRVDEELELIEMMDEYGNLVSHDMAYYKLDDNPGVTLAEHMKNLESTLSTMSQPDISVIVTTLSALGKTVVVSANFSKN